MMKTIVIVLAMLTACMCRAGNYRNILITTHSTTSSVAMTNYADPFTGEIDEIAVYSPSGVTGAVAVAAIDPYSSGALVLATNATATEYMVWKPRIVAPVVGGATSLSVTNTASADCFRAQGERIRAIVSAASKTNQEFRIRLKIK